MTKVTATYALPPFYRAHECVNRSLVLCVESTRTQFTHLLSHTATPSNSRRFLSTGEYKYDKPSVTDAAMNTVCDSTDFSPDGSVTEEPEVHKSQG